jgi:DtxR family manganese transport transcriptional regulator
MKNLSKRALPFIETRNHHESELAEDYVEIISDLILQKGEARILDIAETFGVSHVTVIRTLQRLRKKSLVQTPSHQPIVLTDDGKKLAKFCKERHEFLLSYLLSLGVPEEIAAIDVEGMEHHVSETTINAFRNHINRL